MAAPVTGIDSHAHVFRRGLPLAAERRHAPDYDAPLATWLAHLDAQGLSHGVLVQPSFLGTDNGFMLAAIAAAPQRLRGVAVVAPDIPGPALDALAAGGIVGLRLNLVGRPLPYLAAAPWPALLAQVRARDWHVELHRYARDLPALLRPLLAAGVRVVVDHFGRPDPALAAADPGFDALLRSAASARVWVKLSAAYRNGQHARALPAARTPQLQAADATHARACAQALLAAFGPERLVWGSDWPHTQHETLVDHAASLAALADWVPDPAQRKRILVDTPAALFHFT